MPNLDFVEIGKRIKKRRLSKEITQEQVADRLDVNPSHISNIECGRAHPSLTTLIQIANVLECSVDYFICGEYTFHGHKSTLNEEVLYDRITEKLLKCDLDKRERILKIIDLM